MSYSFSTNIVHVLGLVSLGLVFFSLFSRASQLKKYKRMFTGLVTVGYPVSVLLLPVVLVYVASGFYKKPYINRKDAFLYLFLGYGFVLSTINVGDGLYLPFLVWMSTFGAGWVVYLIVSNAVIYPDLKIKFYYYLKWLVFVEVVGGGVQYYLSYNGFDNRTDSILRDSFRGSFGDAHIFGLFLLALTVYQISLLFLVNRKGYHLFLIVFFGVFFQLTDAKVVVVSIIFGVCVFLLYYIFIIKNLVKKVVYMAVLFPIFILIVYMLDIIVDKTKVFDKVYTNYISNDFSKKTEFYNISLNQFRLEDPVSWVIGTGPGSFGSKANEMISSDILYSPRAFHLQSSTYWTKHYMSELSTRELREEIHRKYSFILTMYYSSFLSIKNEFGVVGLVLFVFVCVGIVRSLIKVIKYSEHAIEKSVVTSLLVLFTAVLFFSFFEIVLESHQIMLPLLFLIAFVLANEKKQRKVCSFK